VSENAPIGPPKGFQADPFEYHEEIELEIDSLSNLGHGVGRFGESRWVVFVPFALAGERVRARVYRNHKTYSDADLLEVISPSTDRVEPRCQLFGTCGGCQYQNLGYVKQLEWKRDQVAEVLNRMAGIDDLEVLAPIPSPLEYGYRSKITPHHHKPQKGQIGDIGFLQAASRSRLVDVHHCPIASDAINAALPAIRENARSTAGTKRKGATLLLRDSGGTVITNPKAIAEETVGELTFSFLAGDFFQNNPSILPDFTGYVAEQACATGAPFLIDAYCGSGLFALTCAPQFERVYGVEISETSADWARANARQNGIENVTFLAASAERIFEDLEVEGSDSAVVIDPPRKGAAQNFCNSSSSLALAVSSTSHAIQRPKPAT